MELRQLEYFVAIVETGSFNQAAERCHVSQPSLSQQIIKLEKEIGRKLFDRLGRSIALTEVGNLLYPHAQSILSGVQQAKYAVTDGYSVDEGSLQIGIIPTLGPYVLHETVKSFQTMYPRVDLGIYEDVTENLIEKLLNAELDIAYMSLPIENKQIISEVLFVESLYMALPARHPLANESVIEITQLGQLPFIRLSDQNCLADQQDAFCYVQKIDPPKIYHTTQISTVMEFVRLGIGVSLIPTCSVALYQGSDVVFKLIHNSPAERTIVASRHRGRANTLLIETFNHCLTESWQKITETLLSSNI